VQQTLQGLAIRPGAGLAYEHMFPRLRQRVLARVDLAVELATLGEYGIDEHGAVMRLDPGPTPSGLSPRTQDRCGDTARPPRCVKAVRVVPARP
jgi:hypothetical protein